MGVILSVANQKGGVGKTTTTAVLAWILSQKYRVLCVDLDMQANLTSMLTLADTDEFKDANVLHVLKDGRVADRIADRIVEIKKNTSLINKIKKLFGVDSPGTLHLLPSHEQLALYQPEPGYTGLSRVLESVRGEYDYIFVDTPPSLDHFLLTALVACDYVIGMVQTHPFAIEGIQRFMRQVYELRTYKPELKMLGLVIAMFEKTKFNKQISDGLREAYPELVFKTTVFKRNRLMEMTATGITIEKASDRKALEQYIQLSEEIENHVRQHHQQTVFA